MWASGASVLHPEPPLQLPGRLPDAVFSGFLTFYARSTREQEGRQIPYLVVGNGGRGVSRLGSLKPTNLKPGSQSEDTDAHALVSKMSLIVLVIRNPGIKSGIASYGNLRMVCDEVSTQNRPVSDAIKTLLQLVFVNHK